MINKRCLLAIVSCDYCYVSIKRYEFTEHDNICSEKPVPCDLQCGLYILSKIYLYLYVLLFWVFRKGNKTKVNTKTSK